MTFQQNIHIYSSKSNCNKLLRVTGDMLSSHVNHSQLWWQSNTACLQKFITCNQLKHEPTEQLLNTQFILRKIAKYYYLLLIFFFKYFYLYNNSFFFPQQKNHKDYLYKTELKQTLPLPRSFFIIIIFKKRLLH